VVLADGAVIELASDLEITVATTISGDGAIRVKGLVVKGAHLTVNGIECAGLRADGGYRAGTRLEARDVRVLNSEGIGISVGNGAAASIEGGSIVGSGGSGILVQGGGATVSLSRVAISDSGGNGISVCDGAQASIEAGSIEGSGRDGVWVGRVAISNSGGYNDIWAASGGTATVREGCTVSGSGGQDYYEDSSGGTIECLRAPPRSRS